MYSLSLRWTFHDLTLKNCFDTLLIDQGQLFPMNSNAVSLLFQLGSILHSDKKFWYRERKIPLWSIKVNISSRKAISQNISIHKYFARCQICGYKFWKWPPKSLSTTLLQFCLFHFWRMVYILVKPIILQNYHVRDVIQILLIIKPKMMLAVGGKILAKEFGNCVEFVPNWESIRNCDVCGWSGAWIKLILIQPWGSGRQGKTSPK